MGSKVMDMNKPIITSAAQVSAIKLAEKFGAKEVVDPYHDLLEELYLIRNPKLKFAHDYSRGLAKFIREYTGGGGIEESGNWVFFPWNLTLVHYLIDEHHQEIRTARNKRIYQKKEKGVSFILFYSPYAWGDNCAYTNTYIHI